MNMADQDHLSEPDDPTQRWEVVGYTADGAEICEDRHGNRWVSDPIVTPGPLSFSDAELEAFLARAAHECLGPTMHAAQLEARRWTREQLASYLALSTDELAHVMLECDLDGDEVDVEALRAILECGWADAGPSGYRVADIVAARLDHVWVPIDVAAAALDLAPTAFAALLERTQHSLGIPHLVMSNIPGAGWRVDVTAVRAQLELSGSTYQRILATADAAHRIALIKSLTPSY